jgi:hypothetical protein
MRENEVVELLEQRRKVCERRANLQSQLLTKSVTRAEVARIKRSLERSDEQLEILRARDLVRVFRDARSDGMTAQQAWQCAKVWDENFQESAEKFESHGIAEAALKHAAQDAAQKGAGNEH